MRSRSTTGSPFLVVALLLAGHGCGDGSNPMTSQPGAGGSTGAGTVSAGGNASAGTTNVGGAGVTSTLSGAGGVTEVNCSANWTPNGYCGGAPGSTGGMGGSAGKSVNDASAVNVPTDVGATADASASLPPSCSLPPGATSYRLVQTRNLASPLPDPTGIAADGNAFWILNGGQNSETNTLVHFDPSTGVTDRTFSFTNLIEHLGTGAYGIAWDGTFVWITVAGNTNKLVTVDPLTGQIMRTMSAPTDLGPSDLEFDGTDLWLSSGTGTIFQIDPTTGGILRKFPTGAASFGRDSGIAYRTGELWAGDLFGGMEVLDPSTGTVLATATHQDGSSLTQEEMGSSCFVDCELVMASTYGITYFDTVPVP